MATTPIRWNVVVSEETDSGLRQFLAAQGGGRKGDLSKFVEEAVKARIFQISVGKIKARNAAVRSAELRAEIDEAVLEVRRERARRRKP